MTPRVARRHATALVQAGSHIQRQACSGIWCRPRLCRGPGGSDHLVDSLVVWGDLDAIATRVNDHLAAEANQVCVQVFDPNPRGLPLRQWREIASLVLQP